MPTCLDCDFCEKPAIARKMCRMHYSRWWRQNRSDVIPQGVPPLERLMARVVREDCGCWIVTGGGHSDGYSSISSGGRNGKMLYGHRLVWESIHEAIPQHLVVDHICKNRRCINVAHLRLVTLSENSASNTQSEKTECANGHDYADPRNAGTTTRGWRYCKECNRIRVGKCNELPMP